MYAKGVSEACGGPGSTRENRIDRVEPEEKRIAAAGKHKVCSLHPVWEWKWQACYVGNKAR